MESVAQAEEPLVVKVRGKSQIELRNLTRQKDQHGRRFKVSFSLVLNDGVDAAASAKDGRYTDGAVDAVDRSFSGLPISAHLQSPEQSFLEQVQKTGDDGAAQFEFPGVQPGEFALRVHFDGDELRDGVEKRWNLDLSRRPTQLRLTAPPSLSLEQPIAVKLALSAEGQPLPELIELSVGSQTSNVFLHEGHAEFSFAAPAQAGAKQVLWARFLGNPLFAPSEAQAQIQRNTRAKASLKLLSSHPRGEFRRNVKFWATGAAVDETGPLAHSFVELWASQQDETGEATPIRLRHGETDDWGHFSWSLDRLDDRQIDRLGERALPVTFFARVVPKQSYIQPCETQHVTVQFLQAEPLPLGLFLLPPLSTVGLWLLSWCLRRFVGPLRRRWQAWCQAAKAPATLPTLPSELLASEPGIRLSQPGILSSLRKAVDYGIDGHVHDAAFGVPLVATVSLQKEGNLTDTPDCLAVADAHGAFVLVAPSFGRYHLTCRCPGYLPQQLFVTLPHRGDCRGMQVSLLPMRKRLFAEWQRVAEQVLRRPVSTCTPAEVLELVQADPSQLGGPEQLPALSRLTALCEAAYYSPRLCVPEMLVESAQLAEKLLAAPLPRKSEERIGPEKRTPSNTTHNRPVTPV